MDSLTHALAISVLFSLLGRPEWILPGIIGAVIIDIDVLFPRIFDRDSRYYLFTHGGITHSLLGAISLSAVMAVLYVGISYLLQMPSAMTDWYAYGVFDAILAGAFLHIGLDLLATPGIPLLAPLTDRKYALGIFAGPSIVILIGTIVYLALIAVGKATLADAMWYVAFFAGVTMFFALLKIFMKVRTTGRTMPLVNPFRWLVIEETPVAYKVYADTLFARDNSPRVYPKYAGGMTPADAEKYRSLPEVKRLAYNSYVVTVAKIGDSVVFRDPIRDDGIIWYPPRFKRLELK